MPDKDNSLLSAIPTNVLVAELKRRTKMEEITVIDCKYAESYFIDVGLRGIVCSDDGPAQIMVVRG